MKVLDRLLDFDAKQLNQLDANARLKLGGPQDQAAQEVIDRVGAERARRDQVAAVGKAAALKAIRAKVADLDLAGKVRIAFTDMPPLEWEHAALTTLAAHPGMSTVELSQALGYSGTYMNWFGHICRDREPWLGPALPEAGGKVIYSALLVDFGQKLDPATGRNIATWTLKRDVQDALIELSVL
jgi:muconolactone delta-isomerase